MSEATAPTYGEILRDPNLRLTPEEVFCAELHASGKPPLAIAQALYPQEFADALDVKPRERHRLTDVLTRRVRWALEHVAQRVSEAHPGLLRAAGSEFSRAVLDSVANRREGRTSSPIVGLLPTVYQQADTPEQWREIVTDPANYRNVSLRSPLANRKMLKQSPVESLRHLAHGHGQELAATV